MSEFTVGEQQLLNVCSEHLPDYGELQLERKQSIEQALSVLTEGFNKQEEKLVWRGLKLLDQLLESLFVLTTVETVSFVRICCEIGFDTSGIWVSIWTSGKGLKTAARLLTPRTPAFIPEVSELVSWDKLLNCAKFYHTPSDTPECRQGSEEALRFHAEQLGSLCRKARFYQGKLAAEQVCEELEPFILKNEQDDDRMQEAQIFLYMLYPGGGGTSEDPKAQQRLEDWMEAWGRVDTSVEWDAAWFGLVRRLAKTGKANFEPYLSILYGRFHSSLKLSANGSFQDHASSQRFFSAWQGALGRTVCCVKAAKLAIEILHVGDSIKRLEHLMMTVRTFIHPSNQGSHAERLANFISALCESFAKRLGRDLKSGRDELSTETKRKFVEALFPLIEMGLNSKSLSVVSQSQAALRHLSWVAPCSLATKTLSELVRPGLDPTNLNRSHQATAAMKALTVLIQPLVYAGPAARAIIVPNLVEFLQQSLPGLDPNDTRKTAVTMMMTYSVLSCVPLVNTTDLTRKGVQAPSKTLDNYSIDPPTENDPSLGDIWDFGPTLAEWGMAFFRRLFTLAQARGKRAKKGMSAQLDVVLDYFYAETAALCLCQMDEITRARAIKEIAGFLLDEGALPQAHAEALALSRACARADPDLSVKALVPGACALVNGNDARGVAWALVILGGVVRLGGGTILLEHSSMIEGAIFRSFGNKDPLVRKLGAKLARRYSRGLLDTYVRRNVASDNINLINEMEGSWGSFEGNWTTLKVEWHLPTQAEVDRAIHFLLDLKQRFVDGILEAEETKSTDFHLDLSEKERVQHRLIVLFQIIRSGLTHMDSNLPTFSRLNLIDDVLKICRKFQPTTNTSALKIITKCLSLLGSAAKGPRGAGGGEYVRAFQMWSAWLREISQSKAHEVGVKTQYREDFEKHHKGTGAGRSNPFYPSLLDRIEPKHVMVKYTETLRQKRVFLSSFRYAQSIRDIEELERPFREVGDALNELCFHSFSVVRICAQRHRLFVDTRFPWLAQNRLLNSTISKLGLASQGRSEELTGAVYLCGNEFNVSQISKRWNLFSKFLTTIVCESPQAISMLPVHRQVKAQERVAKLLHGVLQKWHQYAKNAIPAGEMAQLLLNLSIVGNDPTVHWRRQLGICAVIGILIDPRFENDIPRETVSFVVNMAQCEILPSRTVALSVLRRLLLCGDSCRMLVANEISSKPAEFWLLAGATLAEDRNSAAADDQQADWSVGVGEFIKLVRSLVRRPKFQKDDMILQVNNFSSLSIIDILTIKIAPKDFHAPKADFWAALSSLRYANNIDLLSSVALPTLKRLSTEGESNKDRMIRRMAACELFAGCLMVYPEWSTSFFPILSRMLAELPNASNWCDAASFIAFFSKDSGTSLLMDLNKEMDKRIAATSISDEPETEGEKIIGFAYTSNLLKVLGSLVLDRKQQVSGEMFAKFEKFLLHPYKAVRQSASTSIAAFSAFQIVKHEEATRAILATVSKSKDGLEAGLLFVAVACALGEAKRILTSLIIPLISVVFQAQGHEDLETANLAKNVLTVVASLKCFAVPIKAVEFEQKVCNDYAGHSEWPKRRAAAIFLRTFHSQHSCLLLGLGGGGLVQKTAENLLNDTQAEVRDAARSLLVSLLAGVSPVSLFSAHERYLRMIARPETIKKKQGVLALTALVEACPYSVPSAIPPSVVELSKHVNGTNGTQVKKTLSEFRRTHIDEWADHKKAFSQEQLDELEGVLVSPDYYA